MVQYFINFVNIFAGLRKTIAWFALMGIAIGFRLKGYIDGGQFVDLAKNTFLGFVAGNMTEHISSTVKEYFTSKGKKMETTVLDVVSKEES
jgi:hypothetical protein